jgi:hypothetical protein
VCPGTAQELRPKCRTLYYPLVWPTAPAAPTISAAPLATRQGGGGGSAAGGGAAAADHAGGADDSHAPGGEAMEAEACCISSDLPPDRRYPTAGLDQLAAGPRRLQIVWNHRWEFDKRPSLLFDTLRALSDGGHDFGLVMLGAHPAGAGAGAATTGSTTGSTTAEQTLERCTVGGGGRRSDAMGNTGRAHASQCLGSSGEASPGASSSLPA